MYSRYFLSSTAVLLRPVLLRPEAAHENEHGGKMEKKRTATVFDVVSERKISIQIPRMEVVRW